MAEKDNVQVTADNSIVHKYAWQPLERINNGKREIAKVKIGNTWYRQVVNSRGIIRNSELPEDAWKALESAVLGEQVDRLGAVQDLRAAGLTIPESPFAVQHEFDVISEVTEADVTIDGRASDELDRFQTERKAITVPVVSKAFEIGWRAMGAYNSIPGRMFNTDLAVAAAQVVNEKLEYALFNGFGSVKLSTATETYGYTNHPDVNTGASAGDWGTIGNAEATVKNMIIAQSADNYFGPFTLYVSQTQYDEISTLYKSVDNDVTELNRIENLPQIAAVKPVSANYLAAGYALAVQLQRTVVGLVEAMPFRIVEWQSPDGMATQWRVMTIAAPRVTSTWADRSGVCLSTGN